MTATSASPTPFPIVGIGASAGGIEALADFFRGIPADCGMAFVVVTHLSTDRESLLPQVVERYTTMRVVVAQDGAEVATGHVYVMPANAILTMEGARLVLRPPIGGRRERNPIDIFFAALARDQRDHAVGVVLSGGGGDGTLGIKAIKQSGGLTLAQVADGTAPAHPEMPGSAIATGLVDFAVPAHDMASKLLDFCRFIRAQARQDDEMRRGDEVPVGIRQAICAILRDRMGHDFLGYKSKTFMRRVRRRMHVAQVGTPEGYVDRLQQDAGEVGHLFRDLLINVTSFFRDTSAFDALQETVIPKLFAGRGIDDAVRIWVPGCATGEEVFSIAILLREHIDQLRPAPRVQIFATDIDDPSLAVARAGRYPEPLLDHISLQRKRRFFTIEDGMCVVTKEIRDLCVFSSHSVLRDPPFSRIDLVSCRNLLIYFGPDAQSQVIPTFHYALKPGGYLFLGTSESISHVGELFAPVDKKQRIFRSRDNGATRLPSAVVDRVATATLAARDPRVPRSPSGSLALRQAVETQVIERHGPPYVVVNRDGEVLFYSAKTGMYLEAPIGIPTRQILSIARKGLRLDLRSALRESIETGQTVRREHLAVEGDGEIMRSVALMVEPIEDGTIDKMLFLVVFQDEGRAVLRQAEPAGTAASALAQAEGESRDLRERLQSTIEEYETAIEELKSSNEELVSVNEEMQSSNEELEASKEELQSLNEELQTVNIELGTKLDDLDRANNDLRNLFDSTQIATVFLDRNLVIRSFTPAASRIFRLIPGDRGRPLTDLASSMPYPDLRDHLSHVFDTGALVEHRVDDPASGTRFLVRLIPYRDSEQTITGVVITFVDVSAVQPPD